MALHPTPRQQEALDAYADLQTRAPELFRPRRRRQFILESDAMLHFAVKNDVLLGVLAKTPYVWLVNDLVQTPQPDGSTFTHPYLREIDPPDGQRTRGVVVLATLERPRELGGPAVVLVEQERHATGAVELALPRGFGSPGIDSMAQAKRELREETGFIGEGGALLGSSWTDSGRSDAVVDYVHVSARTGGPSRPEPGEGPIHTRVVTFSELWDSIRSGRTQDGFTLQALALYAASTSKQVTGAH